MSKENTGERLAKLRLLRSSYIGPVTFRHLMERFGSAEKSLEVLPELAKKRRVSGLFIPSRAKAEGELAQVEKHGGQSIFLGEEDYPPLLSTIADAPPVLHVLGNPLLLHKPSLAFVGARDASLSGTQITHHLARAIAQHHICVISGMARGIDTSAHQGALRAESKSSTIAVLAGGFDQIYPKENHALYQKIVETGAVVSEMPPGTEPKGRYFPRRNRIISGLALGVLVIEAKPGSGSLITARMAADQGREVFAIPGSPLDVRSRGPNRLIQEGAVLVETAEDLLDAFRPLTERLRVPEPFSFFSPVVEPDSQAQEDAETKLRELISVTPVSMDELFRHAEVPPSVGRAVLLEMELAGDVTYEPGGRVCKCFPVEKVF